MLSAAALLGLFASIVYTSTAAKFFVYDAQVLGDHNVTEEMIYEAAAVDEQNIFWVDPEMVAARIAELDGIKSVRVGCGLPSRLSIEVEERKPVVLWRAQSQGSDWWLDEDGVVLPYPGVLTETVFVVDTSERQLDVGQQIEPAAIVQSVRQLAAALPQVRVFVYDADRGLSFIQGPEDAPWPVYVGNSDDLERKIQVLKALTDDLRARRIRPRYVDVRQAAFPCYGKPGDASTAGGE